MVRKDALLRSFLLSLLVGLLVACGSSTPVAPTPTLTTPALAAITPTVAADPRLAAPSPSPATARATSTITRTPAAMSTSGAAASRNSIAQPAPPFTLSPTQSASCFAAGFAEPDPATYVALIAPVREYLYHRKRAFIAGDVTEFLARYPALGQGADPAAGINDEARLIALYKRTFTLIDGDIDPEHYERIKVRRDGASAEAIINMLEVYVRPDFSITGGQVRLKLSLQQIGGTWTVVRTDALNEGEFSRERQCR